MWFVAAASPDLVLSQTHVGPALYHKTLELMGGEFAELSAAMKETKKDLFAEQIEAAKNGLSKGGGGDVAAAPDASAGEGSSS